MFGTTQEIVQVYENIKRKRRERIARKVNSIVNNPEIEPLNFE